MKREVSDQESRTPGRGAAQTGARYACRMCDGTFRFQHELDKHEREAHPTDAPPDAPIGQR